MVLALGPAPWIDLAKAKRQGWKQMAGLVWCWLVQDSPLKQMHQGHLHTRLKQQYVGTKTCHRSLRWDSWLLWEGWCWTPSKFPIFPTNWAKTPVFLLQYPKEVITNMMTWYSRGVKYMAHGTTLSSLLDYCWTTKCGAWPVTEPKPLRPWWT